MREAEHLAKSGIQLFQMKGKCDPERNKFTEYLGLSG